MLLGLIVATAVSSPVAAQPAGRTARLHEFVSPLALHSNTEFQFQRSVAEQEAGQNELVIVPLFRAIVRPDGSVAMVPNGVLLAPLYKYDDLLSRDAEAVEFTRSEAQNLVDGTILPAARRLDGLSGFPFQTVGVTVRDVEGAAIEAPRWSTSSNVPPSIVMQFGLNHPIHHQAHVALQFDRVMRLPKDASPEVISAAWSRFVNTYLAAYMSSRQRRKDNRHFFDRGLWDTVYPVEWSLADRFDYFTHVQRILLALLAHEACHHILGHTSSAAGDRRAQELEADICAAAIFVEANVQRDADSASRMHLYVAAAEYISLASMISWPAGVTTTYPAPDERYRAIIASIPRPLREAEPELSADIDQLAPFTAPLELLADADLNLPIVPRGQSAAGQVYELLLDAFYPVRDAVAGCPTTPVIDRHTAFFCSRLEIDKAAITVELIIMRGYAAIQDLAAAERAIAIADRTLARFSFPGLSKDADRLREDLALAKRLPSFDGMASED